jgi:hypothetical protein
MVPLPHKSGHWPCRDFLLRSPYFASGSCDYPGNCRPDFCPDPPVAFRTLKVDPSLENWRDWVLFFLLGVLINNIVGAAWSVLTLCLRNIIKTGEISRIYFNMSDWQFYRDNSNCTFLSQILYSKDTPVKTFYNLYWE